MTNEEINIAIAEATGWILTAMNWWFKDGEYFSLPPDYCTNLNAMHEAENALNDCEVKWGEFRHHLMHIIERTRHELHATARQRAEAFLKTLNLWKQ